MGNLQTSHWSIEEELAIVQFQVREMTLARDAKRARYEEAEKKLDATDDRIADMYMGLQGSIMSKLHHRDPTGITVGF